VPETTQTPPIRRREILLCAGLTAAFYAPYFNYKMMLSGGDFSNLFWPGKLLVQRAWATGVLPLWNPWSYLGTPFAATMQHGVFYPPDWLIFSALPADAGLGLYVVLHLMFCALGMLFWLRSATGISGLASAVIAAAFPMTSWFWGHSEHINQIACASWMPWMIGVAWEFAKGQRRTSSFVGLYGFLSAMQFLSGHPQAAFYTHLAVVGMLACFVFAEKGDWLRLLRKTIIGFGCAGLIGGMVAGAQLLPTLEMAQHSVRAQKDPRYARDYSIPLDAMRLAILPHAFGSFRDGYRRLGDNNDIPDLRAYNEYGMFVGWPMLALALGGVAWGMRRRRRLALFLAVGAVGCFVLAAGGNFTPSRFMATDEFPPVGWSPYDLFLTLLPPAQGFRAPSRILMLGMLLIVSLGALGWRGFTEWLAGRELSPALRRIAPVALLASVFFALYVPSLQEKFRHPVPSQPLLLETLSAPRVENPNLDTRVFRLQMMDDQFVAKNERELGPSISQGNPLLRRWYRQQPNMQIVSEFGMEDGYEEGLAPTLRTKDFLLYFNRNMRWYRPDPLFLSLIGIRYIWIDPDDPNLRYDEETYAKAPEFAPAGMELRRNPMWVGAAFWRDAARGIDFSLFDGPVRTRGERFLNQRTTQAINYGDAPDWTRPWPRLATRVPTPNSIIVEVNSTTPISDVIVTLGEYPGWYITGDQWRRWPVEWISAVHAVVPQDHLYDRRVRLVYEPPTYRFGLYMSAIGAAIAAFIAMMQPRKPRVERRRSVV
jgi:hypothetical protein